MGLAIDGASKANPVGLDPGVGGAEPKARPQEIGLGPSSELRSRSRPITGAVFGFFASAVAAVILSAGFTTAAQAQSKAPVATEIPADSALAAGYARLLAADKNGDGKWIGTRYGNELVGLDPLAQAIFDYVDYLNPRGHTSFWGSRTTGDYQSGGLGLGYSMRPKHMTGNRFLLGDDLRTGIRQLEKQLASPLGNDQVTADIRAILGDKPSADSLGQLNAAAERLLDIIVQQTGKKELATRNETALLTDAELLAALPAGSLERAIAEAATGHGAPYFERELQFIRANGRSLGLPERREDGVLGEAQQQYLLQIAKRAMEAKLLAAVQAAL